MYRARERERHDQVRQNAWVHRDNNLPATNVWLFSLVFHSLIHCALIPSICLLLFLSPSSRLCCVSYKGQLRKQWTAFMLIFFLLSSATLILPANFTSPHITLLFPLIITLPSSYVLFSHPPFHCSVSRTHCSCAHETSQCNYQLAFISRPQRQSTSVNKRLVMYNESVFNWKFHSMHDEHTVEAEQSLQVSFSGGQRRWGKRLHRRKRARGRERERETLSHSHRLKVEVKWKVERKNRSDVKRVKYALR